MTFEALLDQAIAMLKKHRRVSYRALQRQFRLANDDLALLTEELTAIQRLAVDQDGVMLVWTDASAAPESDAQREPETTRHVQVLLPAVILLLQHDRRVTYRTLKAVFALDDRLLADLRRELAFKHFAVDEDGTGLVS